MPNPYRCWCEWLKRPSSLSMKDKRQLEDAKHHAYLEGVASKLPTESELYQALLQAGRNYSGGKGQKQSRVEYEAEYLLTYLEERHGKTT